MYLGMAAMPSVVVWSGLGERIGLMHAYAIACLLEAIAVAASVEWVTISGVCFAAVLLGATFMGIRMLGFAFFGGRTIATGYGSHDRAFRHWADCWPDTRRLPV
jgi:hypothetical protein